MSTRALCLLSLSLSPHLHPPCLHFTVPSILHPSHSLPCMQLGQQALLYGAAIALLALAVFVSAVVAGCALGGVTLYLVWPKVRRGVRGDLWPAQSTASPLSFGVRTCALATPV
jgi:hypothetical protein